MNMILFQPQHRFRFISNLLLIVCFSMVTIVAFSQSGNAKSLNSSDELILSTIRPASELTSVIDEHVNSINTAIQATNVADYDKVLFSVYALMLKEIKNLAPTEGLNVVATVFDKTISEQLIKPEYKIVNPEDLRHLSQGLVELLQVVPQAINTTIE